MIDGITIQEEYVRQYSRKGHIVIATVLMAMFAAFVAIGFVQKSIAAAAPGAFALVGAMLDGLITGIDKERSENPVYVISVNDDVSVADVCAHYKIIEDVGDGVYRVVAR